MERKIDRRFAALTAIFCSCLVAANIFEVKVFDAGPLMLTGGFLLFPISYIINDCLTEVYGYKNARFAILTAFAVNLFIVLAAQAVKILPSSPSWNGGPHFDYVFTMSARVWAASALAFLAGSLLNAKVMALMKRKQGEKGFGWRAIASTFAGESVDSLIFFPIAFWGYEFRYLLTIMATQIVLKSLYEIIILPLTALAVRKMKERV